MIPLRRKRSPTTGGIGLSHAGDRFEVDPPAYPPAVWLFSMELIIDVKSVFN